MKTKIYFLTFAFIITILISNFNFVFAEEVTGGINDEDAQKIQDAVDIIPLDPETGGLDTDKLNITKTRAEERIEKINEWLEWTDPIFNFVFKIPLRLSWEFAYLFFIVLISLTLFHNIPGWIGIEQEWIGVVSGFGITFLLSYFEIFKTLINWIILITNKWWWDLVVLGVLIVLLMIVSNSLLRQWAQKRKEKSDREKLSQGAKDAETMSKVTYAFSEGLSE